jgi:putative ATPase
VLVLNAGSGFLVWEAMRRVPEGGVWALVDDPSSTALLEKPPFEAEAILHPAVLAGALTELGRLLAGRGDGEIRFEAIVGWNALTRCADRRDALAALRSLARAGGSLGLAEVVPSESQRLSELAQATDPGLAEVLRRAEAVVYERARDPRVVWKTQDLAALAAEAGFAVGSCEGVDVRQERRLSAADLDRWLQGDAPYARAVRVDDGAAAADRLLAIRTCLAGRTVSWRRRICFLRASVP